MSRKHYVKFAEMVKFLNLDIKDKAEVANEMADIFAGDNSRFDRGRFLTACGL